MRLLLALIFVFIFSGAANAQKRIALVVGNSAYKNTPAIPNPEHDAEDMAATLKRLGFEIFSGTNLSKSAMEDLLIRFSREVKSSDVALAYYAGHGIQFGGVNYLVPIDAKLEDEADLRRLIRVDDIMSDLQAAKTLRILVLDACRDNPLADGLRRKLERSRSSFVQQGLAKIDSPVGTITAYATQAGRTAEDGSGRNSPFTRSILARIADPTEIGVTFRRIASDVYELTNKQQLPELSISLVGELYLAPNSVAGGPSTASPPGAAAPPPVSEPRPIKAFKEGRRPSALSSAETMAIKVGETFRECAQCPELVVIPAGEFMMGASPDEKNPSRNKLPFHTVKIAAKLAVGRFEVTNAQFAAFLTAVAKSGSIDSFVAPKRAEPNSHFNFRVSSGGPWYYVDEGYEDHPVSFVTFGGATAYVEWLAKTTGKPYRLLTEAEWEYAARATSKTEFYYGTEEDWKQHCDYANVSDLDARKKYPKVRAALCNDGFPDLAPVGKLKPNLFGLHDVYGNVFEWVLDCTHDDYNGAPSDGSAWTKGADCNNRIIRGGSINYLYVSSTDRFSASYDEDKLNVGIRVVRALE
ncbi:MULTISPECIES: SUMF1/EgtB/PvdO family nonheme iron enzyme [unclassified Bradyrhizobium]|uniref:SUMF1/EgtB/PvdO family nonheme iron enzyme n=1 Tax=unclassified Bradyrhizobium TaxID=2631580 RepID=UPI0028EFF182|nr:MULTISPECIES: SUMF1/EgtB/PvdO family nonheme iron enzyme [unclassified Bradyrhizobium]